MATGTPRKIRRWVATAIVLAFMLAVASSAAVGWWFARESPAHQGPILLITVDGLAASALPLYGAARTDTPGIDQLAAEAVVFDRAYAHSPQTLPAHASLLSGRLPPQHGVRDDAGFTLEDDVQTLAESLRSRGFTTGAAVSSFLLRAETGVAQGFRFYDAELPDSAADAAPVLARPGSETIEAAESWVRMQDGRRFFLFVQVDARDADTAVARLSALLRSRGLYQGATIVLVGARGGSPSSALGDTALRVPLIVKQPGGEGAGRHVGEGVQHADLVPTILDLVRAPGPNASSGQSLRSVLTDDEATLGERPLYAEWLAPHYGFGGHPVYTLTAGLYRYARDADERLLWIGSGADSAMRTSAETARLRYELDRMTDGLAPPRPSPVAPADEDRYALLGYLSPPRLTATHALLSAQEQAVVLPQHRSAALLIGQKKYSAGIRVLQAIAAAHPELAVVQHQLGSALLRAGRMDEAVAVFQAARDRYPAEPDLALALADALMRAGRTDDAATQINDAIALTAAVDAPMRAAAHQLAARIALARHDAATASEHARAAQEADPDVPVEQFVLGRLLYDDGKYAEASEAFGEAVRRLDASRKHIPELHLYLGESFAHLERYADAETHYREELRSFPRSVHVYSRLAMLYAATDRSEAVEDVLNELVAETPTPESYAVAARLWTIVGDRSRAEALRLDARSRFSGDPSLALLGTDGRR